MLKRWITEYSDSEIMLQNNTHNRLRNKMAGLLGKSSVVVIIVVLVVVII